MTQPETPHEAVGRLVSVIETIFIDGFTRSMDPTAAAASAAFVLFETACRHPEWAQAWSQLLRATGSPQVGTQLIDACPVSVTSEERDA